MPTTWPPKGQSPQFPGREKNSKFPPGLFPLAVLWSIEYPDGTKTHDFNVVYTQDMLDGLNHLFEIERERFGAKIAIKANAVVVLKAALRGVRVCRVQEHNVMRQDCFCHTCGLPTRLIKVVEDE